MVGLHADERTMQLLLEKGADVKVRNHEGRIALHDAAWFGHRGIAKSLLKKVG